MLGSVSIGLHGKKKIFHTDGLHNIIVVDLFIGRVSPSPEEIWRMLHEGGSVLILVTIQALSQPPPPPTHTHYLLSSCRDTHTFYDDNMSHISLLPIKREP